MLRYCTLRRYTKGRWQFVCDGSHKGCRIMEVFEVRKALGV
jgi:hypothetical protein